MDRTNSIFSQLFATPLMQFQLDLDLEKLTELAFQMREQNQNPRWPKQHKSNLGGWQSKSIIEETHEELEKLKKEITQYLQKYHLEIFQGMKFKTNVIQNINDVWININEKYHYNEWHIHPGSTLSGAYYIKHDGSAENGDILFKHSNSSYKNVAHWPKGLVEIPNVVTGEVISITPKSNMLLLFPGWLEHKAEVNLKDDTRISLSFNSTPISDKKQWIEKE